MCSCADGCTLTLTQQTDGGGDVVCWVYTESFAASLLPQFYDIGVEITQERVANFRRISKVSARSFQIREEEGCTENCQINSSITKKAWKGDAGKFRSRPIITAFSLKRYYSRFKRVCQTRFWVCREMNQPFRWISVMNHRVAGLRAFSSPMHLTAYDWCGTSLTLCFKNEALRLTSLCDDKPGKPFCCHVVNADASIASALFMKLSV